MIYVVVCNVYLSWFSRSYGQQQAGVAVNNSRRKGRRKGVQCVCSVLSDTFYNKPKLVATMCGQWFKADCIVIFRLGYCKHDSRAMIIYQSKRKTKQVTATLKWKFVIGICQFYINCNTSWRAVDFTATLGRIIPVNCISLRMMFNPLNPNSDENEISLYIITTCSSNQVMRIKKVITKDKLSWYVDKFSLLVQQEMHGEQ